MLSPILNGMMQSRFAVLRRENRLAFRKPNGVDCHDFGFLALFVLLSFSGCSECIHLRGTPHSRAGAEKSGLNGTVVSSMASRDLGDGDYAS